MEPKYTLVQMDTEQAPFEWMGTLFQVLSNGFWSLLHLTKFPPFGMKTMRSKTVEQIANDYSELLIKEQDKFYRKNGYAPKHPDTCKSVDKKSKEFWEQPNIQKLDALAELYYSTHLICLGQRD